MDFTALSAAELTDAIVQTHALECAVQRTKLALIAELARREAWREDYSPSLQAWLTTSLNVLDGTAKEYARTAKALEDLPHIADAFGSAGLSWDQVRFVTRFATPETDAELSDHARGCSARTLRLRARQAEKPTVEDARDAHAQRSVRWWWEDGTMLHLSARLPDDQGAIVVKALERTADRQPQGAEPEGYQARFADALVDLAAAFIASDPDPDRANIIVHVDAEVLDGSADGRRHLENAGALASETVRRLACDSRLQLVLDGRDGKPLGVGRMQRTVSPALARLVRERDKGCRVCGRTYCAQVHHQLPWEEGGATDLDNLLELCPRDHWLVHEGGWRLEGDPYKELRLRRPDGRVLELPWVEPGARERILGLLRPSIAPPDTS